MAATKRLGGQYSSNLHPQCTHLVAQISFQIWQSILSTDYRFSGHKFEHALKHGPRNGLFVVTLGWFVDSVRRSVRLNESLYSIKGLEENDRPLENLNQLVGFSDSKNFCVPTVTQGEKLSTWQSNLELCENHCNKHIRPSLLGESMYIDSNISLDLQRKVADAAVEAGATLLDHWFVGCNVTYVVCEGASIQKYIGQASHLVTPVWVLKTAKDQNVQRLVHLSADHARQISAILENAQHDPPVHGRLVDHPTFGDSFNSIKTKGSLEERLHVIDSAKLGVRMRRTRHMQSCQKPLHPITPNTLLDSVCWSISDPSSTACVYMESSPISDINEQQTSIFFDARGDGKDPEAAFDNFTRPLRESEKQEVVFRNHFLTILFPIDRFGEIGPSSRTFFSNRGFSCVQLLDHIYAFYQENMSTDEIDMAIHTDSRHADKLRSIYAKEESLERGYVPFKRIDFMGSRRSFEMLKRVTGDNNSNVYELLVKA
ncbi:hypothetical protein H6P81_002550 [Aristolochia fimbriata]|uniref:BRCT domain-containing protein n=1 Tax=Aristolochia fimbriata TaxID=158543 RepID=A0AAV7FE71_ARIFI|nr:hypothetical protein H6P81_002550 [Aristolochia fimbriata]